MDMKSYRTFVRLVGLSAWMVAVAAGAGGIGCRRAVRQERPTPDLPLAVVVQDSQPDSPAEKVPNDDAEEPSLTGSDACTLRCLARYCESPCRDTLLAPTGGAAAFAGDVPVWINPAGVFALEGGTPRRLGVGGIANTIAATDDAVYWVLRYPASNILHGVGLTSGVAFTPPMPTPDPYEIALAANHDTLLFETRSRFRLAEFFAFRAGSWTRYGAIQKDSGGWTLSSAATVLTEGYDTHGSGFRILAPASPESQGRTVIPIRGRWPIARLGSKLLFIAQDCERGAAYEVGCADGPDAKPNDAEIWELREEPTDAAGPRRTLFKARGFVADVLANRKVVAVIVWRNRFALSETYLVERSTGTGTKFGGHVAALSRSGALLFHRPGGLYYRGPTP